MHFTKTKNQNNNPSVLIPVINQGKVKEVTPSKCMRYLALWFDPQLKFHKHAKIVASKASKATKALCMLGNSMKGINQLCLRQFYLGAILPIVIYILSILNCYVNLCIALTWCPGHFDIEGNEWADTLAKSGSHLIPKKQNYKSLSYIGSLHKHEIGKEWLHRWTNTHMTLKSKFHTANCIPPCTKPTVWFLTLDHCTFSHTIQCHMGHTHIGEYYRCFVPSELHHCHCSAEQLQT